MPIPAGSTAPFNTKFLLSISVDSKGAKGDGTTDDTVAIRTALATGLNVNFTAGKTYIVSGDLRSTTAGQSIYLNGATVKLASQIITTITSQVNPGDTVIQLTSTAGMVAGQSYSLRQAGLINFAFPRYKADASVVFTVSGVSTTPSVGSTWTNSTFTWTVTAVSLTGSAPTKSGTVTCAGQGLGNPQASGLLTFATGTGDATMTYSAFAGSCLGYGSGYTAGAGLPTCAAGATGATITPVLDAAGSGRITSYTVGGDGSTIVSQTTNTATGGTGKDAAFRVSAATVDEAGTAPNILSVDSSTQVTMDGAFTGTFAVGSSFYSASDVFDLQGTGNLLQGPGTIDGNYANFTIGSWQNTSAVRVNANNCTVQNITIQNFPGEGVVIYNSYNLVKGARIQNIWGNGIHFTNSDPTLGTKGDGACKVTDCTVINCNLDPMVGHANGGIIWSNNVAMSLVSSCYVRGTSFAGLGSIDSAANSNVRLTGNTLNLCLTNGADIKPGNNSDEPVQIEVANNRFIDCGMGQNQASIMIQNTAGGTGPADVVVSGNDIISPNSKSYGVYMNHAVNVSVTGNVMHGTGAATNATGVGCFNSSNVTISGNSINGFASSASIQSSTTTLFSNNSCLNALSSIALNAQGGNNPGTVISGNTVSGLGATGIKANLNTIVIGNHVTSSGSQTNGIWLAGNGTSAIGNTIVNPFAVGVLVDSGLTGVTVANNNIGSTVVQAYTFNSTVNTQVQPFRLDVLATVSGVNGKTVAGTLIYTVPTGRSLIIQSAIVRCTAASAITGAPTAGIGTTNGGSEIYAATPLTGVTAAGAGYEFETVAGAITAYAAASTVYLSVTGGATGTSQTLASEIIGYLI